MKLCAFGLSVLGLLVALSGCGRRPPGSGSGDPVPDPAEGTPDAGQEEECSVGEIPQGLTVGEGGRLVVPLSPTGTDVTVEVSQLQPGWTGRIELNPTRLVARAAYDVEGNFGLALLARCKDKSAPKGLLVEVHRASWKQVSAWSLSAADAPAARQMPTLWIDESNPDRMLLFGGHLYRPVQWTVTNDVWALDLNAGKWAEISPANTSPMQASGQVAPIPGQSAVLLHGGDAPDYSFPDDLWRFDYQDSSRTWTKVTASAPMTVGRLSDGFVYDAPRNRYLSVFGYTETDISDQVMEFTPNGSGGGEWKALVTAGDLGERPDARYGFAYALDAENERLVVFSGGRTPAAGTPVNPAQDVWALELKETPVRWVKLTPAGTQPLGRRNACFAFDSLGQRLIIWGGTDDAASVRDEVYTLDLDRGAETWHQLKAANPPPARSSGASVFDPKRNRALFGFGNSGTGIYTDLQALEL